jgi:hypothetical protein
MRLLNNFIVFILIPLIGFFIFSSYVSASCDPTASGNAAEWLKECANNPNNAIDPVAGWDAETRIKELVVSIAEKVLAFGALFAIGAIVYSGIQYTTSYGDDEKIKKAKTTGIYALTGLFLLLTAFSLVNIIVNFIYSFSV